jgi:hypothetical protein
MQQNQRRLADQRKKVNKITASHGQALSTVSDRLLQSDIKLTVH